MPELTEVSKHIMFEETSQGLNLEIVDQDGRSMFADGSKVPYERTRLLIQKLAAPLKATPLRVAIVGHTAAGFCAVAQRIRRLRPVGRSRQCGTADSGARGLAPSHVFAVSGKADTLPLFPDDPSLAANRRVTITFDARKTRRCRLTLSRAPFLPTILPFVDATGCMFLGNCGPPAVL